MLNDSLPKYFDPRQYANQGIAIAGHLPLKQLKELCTILASDEGDAYIHLDFRVEEDKRYVATGSLNATVHVVCQRCMEAVPQKLSVGLLLAFVSDEDHAQHISIDYEPVVMTDGDVSVADIVEQEIILALPIVAYHEESGCNPTAVKYASFTDDAQTPNPFSVLAYLKVK